MLQTGQTPVIWYDILENGVADVPNSLGGSITFSNAGSNTAKIYQMLYSGMGSVRYTFLTTHFPGVVIAPTPTPYLEFSLEAKGVTGGTTPFGKVRITNGDFSVIDENGTRQTITHALVQGDVFEIQVLGNHFRVLLNGAVPHANAEWTSGLVAAYPFESNFTVLPPYLSSPVTNIFILHPPMLFGDWQSFMGGSGLGNTRPDVDWVATGGTLGTATNVAKTTYTAGQDPGSYRITADVDDNSPQTIFTDITIPPLSIIGLREVTLDPGQQVRFRTNYDQAQNQIVTWSVITGGGGSFDNSNLYTAPTVPGNYIIRARYLIKQEERITVTIPAVLTPEIRAAEPGEVVDFNTNIALPTFVASAGAIGSSTGVWIAPSTLRQIVKISATNAQTVSIFVIVLEAFPYTPNYVVEVTAQKRVITSEAEDFSEIMRLKSRRGRYRRVFELQFRNRDLDELDAVLEFWNRMHPGGSFIYKDLDGDESIPGYFDAKSVLRYSVGAGGTCDASYSFRFVERIDF